jgi:hypothetical protein
MTTRKSPTNTGGGNEASDTPRRLTRDLLRAFELAVMIAHSRASEFIEVSDVLAGLYMDNWDRLSRYWSETDEIEKTMRQLCRISPQRWNYWIEYYAGMRASREKTWLAIGSQPFWRWRNKSQIAVGRDFELSSELTDVLKEADEIAPFQDRVGHRTVPIVSSESVLLAIAQNARSAIGRRLLATGLNVIELERAARFPRRPPV